MHDPRPSLSQSASKSARAGLSAGILAVMSDAMLIWDEREQIVACSDEAVRQLSLSRPTLLKLKLSELFTPQGEPESGGRQTGVVRDGAGISRRVELETTWIEQEAGRLFVGVLRPHIRQLDPLPESLQQALAQATDLARVFLGAPTDVALLIDERGAVLSHNETAARLLGQRPGELARRQLYELLPAETGAQLQLRVQEVKNGAEKVHLEWEMGGEWLDALITPVAAGPEASDRFAILARIITARKQNEAHTQSLTRFYHVLSQVNKIGTWADKAETLYEEICRILVEQGGLCMAWVGLPDSERILVQPAAVYGHDNGYVQALTPLAAEAEPGAEPAAIAISTETHVICQDIAAEAPAKPWGKAALARGYGAAAAIPLHIDGRIIGSLNLYAGSPHTFNPDLMQMLLALADDISFAVFTIERERARTQTDAALRRSEERFRTLVEHASDGIFIADAQGHYVLVNSAGCRLLGFERDEILQMHVSNLVNSGNMEEVQARLQYMAKGETILVEREYVHPDGSTKQVEINSTVLPDGRFLGIIRDISERKRQEEALRTYARRLELLQAANLALIDTRDLDTVLTQLLDYLFAFIPYDTANVMLLDEYGHAHLRAGKGYDNWSDSFAVRGLAFDTETTSSFQTILNTQQSLLIPDTAAFPGWIDDPLTAHVRCWLGVPLISGGRVIGFYSIDKNIPNYFTQPHVELAEALSAQAAAAIENARFYGEIRRRTTELEALSDLSASLRRSADIDAMLATLVEKVTTYLDGSRGVVIQTDPACHELIISKSHPPAPDAVGRRFRPDETTAAFLSENTEVCICSKPPLAMAGNIKIDKRAVAQTAGTAIWMPLRSQTETLGFLEVTLPRPRRFAEHERQLLAAFAEVGSITFSRLRFQNTLERRVEERTREILRRQQVAEGLRYILSILNSGRPFEEVLTYIVTQACWLLDTATGVIFRWQGLDTPVAVQVTYGISDDDEAIRLKAAQNAVTQASRTRQPVSIPDLLAVSSDNGTDPDSMPDYQALLAAPLVLADETYGCLTLYFPEPRSFSEEDIAIAVAFAAQATLAIENARLRADAEKSAVAAERNRLARELHDAVTQSLFSASIIADVLPQIWESNPAAGLARLDELRRLTRGALAEMRALLLELRPKALTEVGLDVLLRQLAEAMSNRVQIPVNLNVQAPRALEPDVQVGLYRIAQEALNNVVKHADASAVEVDLSFAAATAGNRVHLSIRDNGRGFEFDTVSSQNLGLKIMRERAEAIGAALDIRTRPGEGVHVLVAWPMQEDSPL